MRIGDPTASVSRPQRLDVSGEAADPPGDHVRPARDRWLTTCSMAIGMNRHGTDSLRRSINPAPKQISYGEFLAELRGGNLTEVQITDRELIGVVKADSAHPKAPQELTIKATRLPGVDERKRSNARNSTNSWLRRRPENGRAESSRNAGCSRGCVRARSGTRKQAGE